MRVHTSVGGTKYPDYPLETWSKFTNKKRKCTGMELTPYSTKRRSMTRGKETKDETNELKESRDQAPRLLVPQHSTRLGLGWRWRSSCKAQLSPKPFPPSATRAKHVKECSTQGPIIVRAIRLLSGICSRGICRYRLMFEVCWGVKDVVPLELLRTVRVRSFAGGKFRPHVSEWGLK